MEENRQNSELILKMTCILSTILKKWKEILLVLMIFATGFDITKTLTYRPQFQTSLQATLYSENNSYSDLEEAVSFSKSLNYILNGQVVKNYVQDKMNVEKLDFNVKLNSVNETNIVNLSIISNKQSNAYYALKYVVEWYEKYSKDYQFPYKLQVNEFYPITNDPININSHSRNIKNGFMISGGLILACLIFMELFKDVIRTPKDIENQVDCRLFAKIPKENKPRGKRFWIRSKKAILITSLKTSFFYKESIKKLRNRVEGSCTKHGYKSILITSSIENEGKSSIGANLAIALAQNGHKVLLIDGDIRKPSLHKIFSLRTNKFINKYLVSEDDWENQIENIKNVPNLYVICAKQDLMKSEELLCSNQMRNLINETKYIYDYVIVDSSPLRYINDAIFVNDMVDASMIVVKQNEVNAKTVNITISKLVNVKNNLIGCIYNASVTDFMKKHRAYGYQYGYRYTRSRRGK